MERDPEMPTRPVYSWPAALLPGLALVALLLGSAGPQQAADDRPAGRTVVELEVSSR